MIVQAWRWLVEGDADLAGVASVLADYGQQYVDELAREYLADTDKARLPEIVDGIIARARRGVAPSGGARPAVDARPRNPVGGPNAVAVRPDRQPRPLPEAKPKTFRKIIRYGVLAGRAGKTRNRWRTVQAPIAAEFLQSAEDRSERITSADEELTACSVSCLRTQPLPARTESCHAQPKYRFGTPVFPALAILRPRAAGLICVCPKQNGRSQ